jgi:hypothetical protein
VGIVGNREAAEPGDSRGRLAAMPKVRFRRPPIRVLLAMVLSIAALAGCNSAVSLPLPGTGPLVTVSTRGGMCPAGACDKGVILDRDGHVHAAAKPPNDLGQVPADVMATLSAAVQATDYAALRSHPFTGECPVNFDGQELVFEFGAGAGTQRIASCEVDIDWGHPLFVAVGAALGAWVSMPLT